MYVVPTAKTVRGMAEALSRMARLALRAASGEPIGFPEEEGEAYLPRGVRVSVLTEKTGARRVVEMVVAKVQGLEVRTEVPLGAYPVVPPAPPLKRLAGSRIALVTSSGVVPKGNPDRFKTHVNDRWAKYPIDGMERLETGVWETVHGGYNTEFMTRNPHFGVPLDALRALEREGVFGSLLPHYYVVPGNQVQVSDAHRMAAEMAKEMREDGGGGRAPGRHVRNVHSMRVIDEQGIRQGANSRGPDHGHGPHGEDVEREPDSPGFGDPLSVRRSEPAGGGGFSLAQGPGP